MHDDSLQDIPYRRDTAVGLVVGGGSPRAWLSGWDDEQVYLNVVCACGRTFQHGPLSPEGTLRVLCSNPACGRIYTTLVTIEVRGGPGDA
jgi:hypothetical protein